MNWAKIGLFAGGALFGSAGIEILTSKDEKKLYTQCTAAVLRMKDQVMKPSPRAGKVAEQSEVG